VSTQFSRPTKLLIIMIIFRIKCLSYSKKGAILWVLYFLFLRFFILYWKTCQIIWENFVSLVIFDTCDVVHSFSIFLLPPIVLANLTWNIWTNRTHSLKYPRSTTLGGKDVRFRKITVFEKDSIPLHAFPKKNL